MILEARTTDFIEQLSSAAPTPGGGGASAAVGAFAAALGLMVANLTVGKKKYADVEEEIIRVRERLEELRNQLIMQVDEDAKAFEPLAEAYRLPRQTEEEQNKKARIMEHALCVASNVPLEIMETILEAMKQIQILGEKGSRLAVSDAGAGILFAEAALESASFNVFINTKMMQNRECADELNGRACAMIEEGKAVRKTVYEKVLKDIR